ncbi:MAG: FkbM family methyltransferase [Cyanobacteria bacterium]|jgi:FkbM family methyltransferase|nr:FkbM family methyltransferase [Cyanobacteria bacterium GSL.Bin1]
MGISKLLRVGSIQRGLARSRFLAWLAVKLRNQCTSVIGYHLGCESDPTKNGELMLIRNVAPTASVFIDIGANIGNWTNLLLESVYNRDIHGLLIEPSEKSFKQLKQKFFNTDGLELLQAAASDVRGECTFYERPNAAENSSLVFKKNAIPKLVKTITLDDEISTRNYNYIDFLKIETEGWDLNVLRGAASLLDQKKIGVIQFEYGSGWLKAGNTLAAAYSLLESYGYQVFLLKSSGLHILDYSLYGDFFRYSNFVAVSPEKVHHYESLINKTLI